MSQKLLKLIHKENVSPSSYIYHFERSDGHAFDFVGGQYVILNSGDDSDGKAIKRAYSILSSDSETESFRICVKCLGTGKASSILPALKLGDELEYSGPWGKFVGDPTWPSPGFSLILATDTGITSLAGLLLSKKFSGRLESTTAVWLKTKEEDFLSENELKNILSGVSNFPNIFQIPPISDPERVSSVLEILKSILGDCTVPENAFLSGDGNILREVRSELVRLGTLESRIGMEAFFNTHSPIVSLGKA
ncbi:flavodoxin reductase [Leptospira hartskeerlii]|uniref:Flavodoxin reductase n=1 Tax=Leptospira hartskeerlii TaxID=2023177 RepID=A0A2M9XFE1_9LEPT|nr:FAD-dependent oxidoreductase [Leptospira hartskeerlii]PJZ26396.1 flavodoxin reductase [Leptospira hartskeerlii]PJZ34481.1 flavodoxin reductase [Leptospira hartskeerlii]